MPPALLKIVCKDEEDFFLDIGGCDGCGVDECGTGAV